MLAKSEWKDESLSYEPITDIITTPNAKQTWVHLTLDNGNTITTTDGHPFNTPEGWRNAILLKKGGQLLLKGEEGEPKTITITNITVETKHQTTYNLEVANAHTFFVGEDGVLVHNGFGAYLIQYNDGTWYAGKGDQDRMERSAKRYEINGRQRISCNHFQALSDRDSFIMEDQIIEAMGDIYDPHSLNLINSPGKKIRGR